MAFNFSLDLLITCFCHLEIGSASWAMVCWRPGLGLDKPAGKDNQYLLVARGPYIEPTRELTLKEVHDDSPIL